MLSLEALEDRTLLSVAAPTNVAAELSSQQLISSTAPIIEASPASSNALAAPTAGVAAITSIRDGLWSDSATWSSGRVPGAADDVVINNNVTIDHATVHQLDIDAGTVTLAGDLQAYASVIVRSRLVGTQGGIYFHVPDDRLFTGNTKPGPDPTMPDFHPEDIGLWVLRGASVDLQGAAVTSWLNALGSGPTQDIGKGVSQQVAFSAGSATLQSVPVGWQPGDTLLLVNEQGQSVLANLVSINGSSIQYHEQKANPTDPNLVGHVLVTTGSNTVVYPKIANLTRRIQIVGADVHTGDTNHRAQTIVLAGATANLVNVEFRDLGPRGKVGRFPVYFDQGGAVASTLTGSSLWQDVTDPGNRFVAMRNVQGLTVANNVAFRSQGDGFFMEDGTEFGNSIVNNLSVDVTSGEELANVDSDVTELSHHFWLRTGNTISGNVAAGGDAVGMIILAGAQLSATVVTDTQVLGAGLYGMWTGTPNVTFNNPVAVYNSRAGFASDPAWDVDSHGTTLNNPLFLFNGTSDSSYGSQLYLNDSGIITVNGGVLAGVKAVHTHYHSAFVVSNSQINVDTVLTPTYWEQAGTFDHDSIHAALLFENAYPAPRYTSPGIVHFVSTNVQIGNSDAEVETADYMGDNFQNYPALPGTPIPNAIELLHPAPASGFIRVTLLPDDERWMTNIARWTVTPIGQTPQKDSFIYQRQSAWTPLAALGGYPDGFPPGQYAVSLYTDAGVLLKTGFADVRSGQVSDLTDSLPGGTATVVGRQLFYNNSIYDGNNNQINAADDGAIAPDKVGFAGVGKATFSNVSGFSKGINGVMVDIASGFGSHSNISLTSGDITFKVAPARFITSTYNQLSTWTAAPTPLGLSVRLGAGVGGSDRVEITWADGAVRNTWLQVTVAADANTGLSSPDVFYFGSAAGDSGAGDTATLAKVDGNDYNAVFRNTVGLTTPVGNALDYNKDGKVDGSDAIAAINNVFSLHYIANPLGPSSSTLSLASSAVPSGLSALNSSSINLPTTLDGRLQSNLASPPVANASQSALHAPQILQAVEQIAHKFNVHDDALDHLLTDLGLG